jgi:hypothetical protein
MHPIWPLFDRRLVTRMVRVPVAGGSADDGEPARSAAAAASPMEMNSLNRTTNEAYVRTLTDATFDVFADRFLPLLSVPAVVAPETSKRSSRQSRASSDEAHRLCSV